MGERSNIFVRMRGKNYGEKTFKHETFFGLYYQWCYGERMISRLRSAVDFIQTYFDGCRADRVTDKDIVSKFKRFLAVNFDMRDVVEPVDLIPEAIKDVKLGYYNSKADIFAQEENHGFIYIDVTVDGSANKLASDNKAVIKYAFVEYEGGEKETPVRSVTQFADHDMGDDERKWYTPDPHWDSKEARRWGKAHKKTFLNEIVPTCKANIKEINSSAEVMTEAERKEFVKAGRKYTKKILEQVESDMRTAMAKRQDILNLFNPVPQVLRELVDQVYPVPQTK